MKPSFVAMSRCKFNPCPEEYLYNRQLMCSRLWNRGSSELCGAAHEIQGSNILGSKRDKKETFSMINPS